MVSATKLVQKFTSSSLAFSGTSGFLKSGAAGGAGLASPIMANLGTAWKAVGNFANTAMSFFKPSDVRLKEEIQLIGKSQSGINIYRFKYKDTDGMYEGVMAQEVPWAAEIGNDGYYMVDYNKVDVEFRRLN